MSSALKRVATAVLEKSTESRKVVEAFFSENADKIAQCAFELETRLSMGGTLYAFGNGGSSGDAAHVAVEFTHPIFEKRKAFRAVALPSDVAWLTAVGNDEDFALTFSKRLELMAEPQDIALGISTSGSSRNVVRGLHQARKKGLLTVGFAGRDGGEMGSFCDHLFVVPSFSIHRIQEVHTVLMHTLWDAVHLAQGEEDIT